MGTLYDAGRVSLFRRERIIKDVGDANDRVL